MAVNFRGESSNGNDLGRNVLSAIFAIGKLVCAGRWRGLVLSAALLACGISAAAQTPDTAAEKTTQAQSSVPDSKGNEVGGPMGQSVAGAISGTVVDKTGAVVAGAHVKLSRELPPLNEETLSDSQGQFAFSNIAAGPFQLTTEADGFAAATFTGTLNSGETCLVPPITLTVAGAASEVRVTMSRTDMAEAEIKDEEKQRVFGIVPNFYVTYDPAAAPLNRKQKFELAWKATIDPVSFGITGVIAGVQQATNSFSGYGQGAQGYGKRYGASYADLVTSTYIGSAILPSLLKQDPRYFYKGTGSVKSRIMYAIANAVICKGDNGRWEPNYSGILGSLASGGISNLYYPAANRNDATLTVENTLIGIGSTAAANILQEFVIRRFTPHAPTYAPVVEP